MRETRVSIRYAKSLIDLSLEKGILEKTYADMQLVLNVCKSNPDFSLMLRSPIIKTDKKLSILKEIFKGKLTPIAETFIEIIARKKREYYLETIAEEFLNQYKQHKKILTAVITTAVGLDDTLRKKVLEILKNNVQSEVELVENVKKELIGGFVLRIADKQVDASIARKIQELTKSFSENPYIKEY